MPYAGRTTTAPLFGTPRVATRASGGRRVPVRHTAAGARPKSREPYGVVLKTSPKRDLAQKTASGPKRSKFGAFVLEILHK